jgi:uncharacterized phage protein (TIGR02216 family)
LTAGDGPARGKTAGSLGDLVAYGLGVMRLSPEALWAMSLSELRAALRGARGEAGKGEAPARSALAELMRQFPDFT